jgi:hypothetical protein
MNIQTVLDNLDNTIAGKEQYLRESEKTLEYYIPTQCDSAITQFSTVIDMLKINIRELKRIRADVALCIPPAAQARDMMQGLWKA